MLELKGSTKATLTADLHKETPAVTTATFRLSKSRAPVNL